MQGGTHGLECILQDTQQFLEQLLRSGLGDALRSLEMDEVLDVRERATSALRLLDSPAPAQ